MPRLSSTRPAPTCPAAIPLALAALLVAAAPGSLRAAAPTEEAQLQADIAEIQNLKVSLVQAIAAAEQASRGKAMDASIEIENGNPVYRVLTYRDRQIWEGTVNATTGAVTGGAETVDVATLDDEDKQEIATLEHATVSLADAAQAAERKTGGRAMDVGLEARDGKMTYVAEVLKGHEIQHVAVDPGNGAVVAVTVEPLAPEAGSSEPEKPPQH